MRDLKKLGKRWLLSSECFRFLCYIQLIQNLIKWVNCPLECLMWSICWCWRSCGCTFRNQGRQFYLSSLLSMTANTINGQYQTVLGIYQNLHLPSSEALKTDQNVNCNILDLHCARTLLDVSTQVAASEGRVVALQSIGRPTISGNYKYKYTNTKHTSSIVSWNFQSLMLLWSPDGREIKQYHSGK